MRLARELCRLALFLDPRYRAGAASIGSIQEITAKVYFNGQYD
jgi:hypothetical protein